MALWHFLAYFIFTSCLVAGQQTRYVLKGAEVSLNPGIPRRPDNILWMHKGNKVVEFNSQEEDVYEPFRNRITLNWHTAELSITNLGFQDTGDYELEAYMDSTLHTSKFNLEVIDNVPKPTISCETTDCSSSNMSATLVCAVDAKQPQSSTKFEWSSNGKTQPGSKLTIPLGKENDDAVYTCTVSNPLSLEEATFTAKDCHSDCSSVAPIIISVILVIMLVLVGLGIMYCKIYKKACFETDVEKQTKSGATEAEEKEPLVNKAPTPSSNQQQHHGGSNLMPDEAASSHKGDTDSDQDPAKVDDMNLQDDKPQKGLGKDNPEETVSLSPSQQSEAPPSSNHNKLSSSDKGDSDAGQVGKPETEVSQSVSNEAVQPGASSSSQDTESNPGTSTVPEQPGLEKSEDKPEENAPPSSNQNKLPNSDNGDSDADRVGKPETEDSQSVSEAVQPGALSSSQDTESNPETSTVPEQPVLVPACFAKVETDDSEKQMESGATKRPPEENEPLVNNGSTPSSTQQQHQDGSNLMPNEAANGHKGDTDPDPKPAEVDDMNLQDEKPQKGHVDKMRGHFESPGKSKDEPEENAHPSTSQKSEPTSSSDQKKPVRGEENDKSDAVQVGKQQTENPHSVKEPDQAGVSATSGEENPETLPSPEQQSLEKSEDNAEENAPPPSNQNKLPNSNKGDLDAGWVGKPETEDSQSVSNEAVQPGALSSSQDTESNLETSTVPEQPGTDTELS